MTPRIVNEYPAKGSEKDLKARLWEFIDLIEPEPKKKPSDH